MTRTVLALVLALAVAAVLPAPAAAIFRDPAFSSPDGNIGCWISRDFDSGKYTAAHCFAQEHDWQAKPRDCGDISDFEEFVVKRQSRRGVRHTLCIGGVPWNIDYLKYASPLEAPALRPGHTKRFGPFRCRGRSRSRLGCRNTRGHGFFVGRHAFKLF